MANTRGGRSVNPSSRIATAAKPVMNMTRIPGWRSADLAGQLDAVETRHHHVGEQQVEVGVPRERQRGEAVADRIDRVPRPLQTAGQKEAQVIVVFGEEDAGHISGFVSVKAEGAGRASSTRSTRGKAGGAACRGRCVGLTAAARRVQRRRFLRQRS